MMRQSETRRLTYCQICSLNSGWFRICLNTLMSGSIRPIARVQVASEMPLPSARARKSSRHGVEAGWGRRRCKRAVSWAPAPGWRAGRGASGGSGSRLFHARQSSGARGLRQNPLRRGNQLFYKSAAILASQRRIAASVLVVNPATSRHSIAIGSPAALAPARSRPVGSASTAVPGHASDAGPCGWHRRVRDCG